LVFSPYQYGSTLLSLREKERWWERAKERWWERAKERWWERARHKTGNPQWGVHAKFCNTLRHTATHFYTL